MFIVNAVTKPFLAGSTPETCWSKLKISADVILNAQLKIVQIFYTVNSCEYFILHIDWTRPCLSPLVKRDLVNSIPGLIYATACFMRGGTPPPLHTELLHVFSPQKGSTRFFWQKISFRHAWLMLSCCNIIWNKAFWYFEPKPICVDLIFLTKTNLYLYILRTPSKRDSIHLRPLRHRSNQFEDLVLTYIIYVI